MTDDSGPALPPPALRAGFGRILVYGFVLTALLSAGVVGLVEHEAQGLSATAAIEGDSGTNALPAPAIAPGPLASVPPATRATPQAAPDPHIVKTASVRRGDTLMRTLVSASAVRAEAAEAIASLREVYDPRRLKPGQEISITLAKPEVGDSGLRLLEVTIEASAERSVAARRGEDGSFTAIEIERELRGVDRRIAGVITDNLFTSGRRADLPVPVIMRLIRLYSWDVDFQRDIQRGDTFTLMFDMLVDEAGNEVQAGIIFFASMNLSGADTPLYRYELADGRVDYFDIQGRSTRKALMRTPIDGARLSSRFGVRRHPVQGYNKMHKGLDFAAPRGTPIYAAGDGVVERASRHGGYGNYVRIRHNSDYRTAYAHMKSYAKGIYAGKRVIQGQTIGFVGSTGQSTGPHLHYEILHNGKQVNPLSVRLPTGVRLAGTDLARFAAERDRLQVMYAELPGIRAVAQEDAEDER